MDFVLIGVGCFIIGMILSFFVTKKVMMDYLKKNPPINEQMIGMMMTQMGGKPSQKKINQVMKAVNAEGKKK